MSKREIPHHPRILVVGSGAREHTIVWKLAQSDHQPVLFAAPGNPGIATLCTCVPLAVTDVSGIVRFAQSEKIDLVVVGPEQPLSLGLTDACEDVGILVFGPSAAAAQLESSKAFAKDIMAEAHVPTARYATFTDYALARAYVEAEGAPIVIKADGLAAGKGVVVAETQQTALRALAAMMQDEVFGAAGSQVVIESFMEGREVSLMYFVDGETVVPMVSARDHKRVYDGDLGPNTGGMGAFAPVHSFAAAGTVDEVTKDIVRPTLRRLGELGIRYRGVLYVGLMLTENGPQVVEFNARFGDPETEVVLPLLATDLVDVFWAVSTGTLSGVNVQWKEQAAVCVVLAAPGYPTAPRLGGDITFGKVRPSEGVVFHAGTKQVGEIVQTAGGRVLTVTAVAASLPEARQAAYETADCIHFEGKHFRKDIGETS